MVGKKRKQAKVFFQERDAELLKWVNGFGFASVEQICQWMGVRETTGYVRVKKLVDGGYLVRERVFHQHARIHKVTKKGALASDDPLLPVKQITLGTYKHNFSLVDLGLMLEKETGGIFVPARRIRYNLTASGVAKLGHIPDGYLHIEGRKPIVVELKLSVKWEEGLRRIIEGYAADSSIEEVWYYTDQDEISQKLESASGVHSFIKVKRLPEIGCDYDPTARREACCLF